MVRIAKPATWPSISSRRAITEEIKKIEPTRNDVLKGRGKRLSRHPGNTLKYHKRNEAAICVCSKVWEISLFKARLGRDSANGPARTLDEWIIKVSKKEALLKIRQALREEEPDLLKKSGVASPSNPYHQQFEGEGARPKEGETEQHISMVSFQTRNKEGKPQITPSVKALGCSSIHHPASSYSCQCSFIFSITKSSFQNVVRLVLYTWINQHVREEIQRCFHWIFSTRGCTQYCWC